MLSSLGLKGDLLFLLMVSLFHDKQKKSATSKNKPKDFLTFELLDDENQTEEAFAINVT